MFGYAPGTQTVTFKSIVISSNQTNWNLITDGFGGVAPTRKAIVTITINSGVDIDSVSPTTPALDLRGLPANSKITLINLGNIYADGGGGGKGENCSADF